MTVWICVWALTGVLAVFIGRKLAAGGLQPILAICALAAFLTAVACNSPFGTAVAVVATLCLTFVECRQPL